MRNAPFSLSGYSYATGDFVWIDDTVSTETNPDAPVISKCLLEGSYDVGFMGGGWYMEHLTASGPELVEKAVFLGPSTQYVYVYRNSTSTTSFRFGVNGELVDFYGGQLEIGISVEQAPTGSGGASGGVGAAGDEATKAYYRDREGYLANSGTALMRGANVV